MRGEEKKKKPLSKEQIVQFSNSVHTATDSVQPPKMTDQICLEMFL